MITEQVYSPINDPNIKTNLETSPIWKDCYKEGEVKPKGILYKYSIKFNGLKPIQVVKIQQITN
jgi:hypothetical protein